MNTTTLTTHTSTAPTRTSLTAMDRCDRCGAQAYFVVNLNATELQFCKHHFDKNKFKLIETGWQVVLDESHRLND